MADASLGPSEGDHREWRGRNRRFPEGLAEGLVDDIAQRQVALDGPALRTADQGVIERAGRTIRPTPKGRPAVEEIGYVYVP